MKLEYAEPAATCEIKVGTFIYNDGKQDVTADFFITTCDDSNHDKRMEDYNDQFSDEWNRLSGEDDYSNIRYEEVAPLPL